ncbi:MAG: retroviral-like aspartic protease family protein [Syntrophales bacterium]|jgi:clan AA aspartic protease (TIGR02281 family)
MARFIIYILFFFLAALFYHARASADIYRWIDPSGTIHIADDPTEIPPQYRKNLKIMKEDEAPGDVTEIPFERTSSGLILVEAVLNGGVKAKMVFDTGADIVVITEELSKKLRQDLSQAGETIKLYTNCGEVKGISFVVDKIELGNVGKENVRSVITPDDFSLNGFEGFLGLSFLGDFKITVDYQRGRIKIVK